MKHANDWNRSGRNNRPLFNLPTSYHLVYSEGKNSEPFYLEGIKKEAEESGYVLKGTIKIDHLLSGEQGSKLVDDAKRRAKNAQKELEKKNPHYHVSHVWIFFDYDGKKKEYEEAFSAIEKLNDAEKKKPKEQRINWHPCWSSYCFEEWLLLHFCYCESGLVEKDLEDKLSSQISKAENQNYTYSKSDKEIFSKVYSKERVVVAVNNAAKLNAKAAKRCDPYRNPSTGVGTFVSFFLKNVIEKRKN